MPGGARVVIEDFGGQIPRRSNKLLPETHAELAANVHLESGEIRALDDASILNQFPSGGEDPIVNKAYRLPNDSDPSGYTWVGFENRDEMLYRGPLLNDAFDRYYRFSSTSRPLYNTLARIANDDPWYYLGVDPPSTAPTLGTTGGTGTDETRSYVYTFVSEYGEEGPPSDPVTLDGPADATSWDLSNLEVETDIQDYTNKAFNTGTKKIYRTVVGYTTVEFFFVAEIPITQTTYTDTSIDSDIARNSLLESQNYFPPPTGVSDAILMPNGFFIGWEARDIHMSYPYLPHAWPPAYDLSVEYDIIGGGVFGPTAGLVTEGNPYMATGVNPAAVTLTKSNTVEPGLAKYSIVSLRDRVVYASQNGLISLGHEGVLNLTTSLLTKEDWLVRYSPPSIWAAKYEDKYLAFYTPSTGFVIAPNEPMSAFTELTAFINVDFVQTDPFSGEVFMIRDNAVWLWDDPNQPPVAYQWKSKIFEFERPCNLGAAIVDINDEGTTGGLLDLQLEWNQARIAEAPLDAIGCTYPIGGVGQYTLTVSAEADFPQLKQPFGGSPLFETVDHAVTSAQLTIYADGNVVYSEQVRSETQVKLPSGFKARHWQFEITGEADVYSIKAAETAKGLADV